jgi:hypothetical protein
LLRSRGRTNRNSHTFSFQQVLAKVGDKFLSAKDVKDLGFAKVAGSKINAKDAGNLSYFQVEGGEGGEGEGADTKLFSVGFGPLGGGGAATKGACMHLRENSIVCIRNETKEKERIVAGAGAAKKDDAGEEGVKEGAAAAGKGNSSVLSELKKKGRGGGRRKEHGIVIKKFVAPIKVRVRVGTATGKLKDCGEVECEVGWKVNHSGGGGKVTWELLTLLRR